jgi:ribose transport system permease protein
MADVNPAQLAGGPPAAPSGGAGLSARQVQIRSMVQAAGMLPVLIILGIGFHYLTGERFFTGQNIPIVAQQAAINTVLASGMTFVILTGGSTSPWARSWRLRQWPRCSAR